MFRKNYFNPILRTVLLILAYAIVQPVVATAQEAKQSIFDLMTYREVVDVTLEADFGQLKSDLHNDDYHPAHLAFKGADGQMQDWDIKVKLRGAFRRMKCADVPPLKLNFKKSDLEAAGLAKFDDLKLVPQLVQDQVVAKELVMKEYLTYKLYNQISDYSFRVQLLRITYKDVSTGKKDKQWAFIIEDAAQLRSRFGAEKADKSFNLSAENFHNQLARKVAVFEYMIGNADWGFGTRKNVKFMDKKGKIIPVPYDFDFSGLVNAPYAVPNSNFGLTSVQQRIYLGFPEDVGKLHGTIYHVVGKRADLESVIMDFKYLNYASRLEMIEYLSTFFDNPESFKKGEVMYIKEKPESLQMDK